MAALDFYELSVEQEEYLVELLCTRGACTVDWLAHELDELCRASAIRTPAPLLSEPAPGRGHQVPPR
jgi:hypothetical protein